jgi:hypothetical protein
MQLPLEEQADYSDYVTKKMCRESPEIVESFAQTGIEGLKMYIQLKTKMDSCVLGSLACIALALPCGDTKELYLTSLAEYMRVMS